MTTQTEALKLALEALIGARAFLESDAPVEIWSLNDKAITAIKEALAQPEQEPVAWRGYNWGHSPDDWVYRDFDDPILDGNGNNVGQPLYTTPPQRTWVDLTEDEIQTLLSENRFAVFALIRAVESKLKAKNFA